MSVDRLGVGLAAIGVLGAAAATAPLLLVGQPLAWAWWTVAALGFAIALAQVAAWRRQALLEGSAPPPAPATAAEIDFDRPWRHP